MNLLEFLFIFSVIVAGLSLLHLVPNRVIFWICMVLSAAYAGAAIVFSSWQAIVMAAFFLANGYLRVALAK